MSSMIGGLYGGFVFTGKFLRATWLSSAALGFIGLTIHNQYSMINVLLVLAIAVGYAFGFVLNDYFDREFDAFDRSKAERNFFVKHQLSKRQALILVSAIIAFLTSVFGYFQMRGLFILSLSLFISWAYSAKPFRFKSRPGYDLISHAFFISTFPYWITVYLTTRSILLIDWMILALTFLLSLTGQLENQIRDFDVDILNDFNFTQKFGIPLSAFILRIATLAGYGVMLSGIFLQVFPMYLWPYVVLLSPWMLHRFIRKTHEPRSLSIMQMTLFFCVTYTMILFLTLPFTY